jgi:hypothetical protein
MTTEQERIKQMVKHWCPSTCHHEDFEIQVLRAFLAATSCCSTMKDLLDGKNPIRPLHSFPDPKFGFE